MSQQHIKSQLLIIYSFWPHIFLSFCCLFILSITICPLFTRFTPVAIVMKVLITSNVILIPYLYLYHCHENLAQIV